MKSLLFSFVVTVAVAASSHAATYVVSNVVGGVGDTLFAGTNNSLLTQGVVSMGYFPSGYTVSSSLTPENAQSLVNNFTSVASAIVATNSATLGGSFAGYVEGPLVEAPAITGGNALIGRTLYGFVGNAATLSESTSIALFVIGVLADDVPFNNTYQADPANKNITIGQSGTYTGSAGGDTGIFNTIRLVAIVPEPSTLMLGAVGALGLLRRRR